MSWLISVIQRLHNITTSLFYTYRKAAAMILDTAQGVLRALNGSRAAQDKARSAIDQADMDIKDARTDLTQVRAFKKMCTT